MPVPNQFANVTTSIPLSQLDANFNTPITLGNTAIQLGNTVTTLNNMTFANATITSGNVTLTNVSVTTANVTTANITTAIIATANVATANVTTSQILNYGTANQVQYLNASKSLVGSANLTFDGTTLTVNSVGVGRGAGNVATNTAVGASALAANTTGLQNVAVGREALTSNTTASNSTAVGYQTGFSNTTGAELTALGAQAGRSNTTGINNTFLGASAGYTNSTGQFNTYIGNTTGYSTTGSNNTFVGYAAGNAVTSGTNNTILGGFSGNQNGLDIRTGNNYAVLSDGAGVPLIAVSQNRTTALEGAVPNTGTGITFPATQNASSNANTLDDYEEGDWTPTITYTTPGTLSVSYSTQNGTYTKIGNIVILNWGIRISAFTKGTASGDLRIGGVPFNSNFDTPIGTVGLYNSSFTTQPVAVPGNGFISLYRLVNNSAWVSLDDPDSNAQYFGTIVMRVA